MRWKTWAVVFAVGLSLANCDEDEGDAAGSGDAGEPTDGPRARVLASMGPNVFLPGYQRFATAADALKSAADALVAAPADDVALAAARDAWLVAATAWQAAELLRTGPAGSSALYTGGADLRDELYSWPTTNSCRVDQELVAGEYTEAGYFDRVLVNVVGLDALEYLLFGLGEENTCPPLVPINSEGRWAALSEGERQQRRADFAAALAGELLADADRLVDAWRPTGADFSGQLARAAGYDDQQAALNELFWAMFYLDRQVKDLKLAVPAGISPECDADVCPGAVESPFARASKAHLVGNLEGFRALFIGSWRDADPQPGFDDLCEAAGADDLATRIVEATDAAISAVEAIPGTLHAALLDDPESVRAAHVAVKTITDLLKSQLVTVLNLSVPAEGAGDND